VVSGDAHPIRGSFTFTVGDAEAAGASVVAGVGSHGNRAVGITFGIVRGIAFGSVLFLVGAVTFVRFRWREAGQDRLLRALLAVACGLVFASALAGIGLQAAYANGRSLTGAFDTDLVGDVLDSRFGQAWLARAGLIVVIVFLARVLRHRESVARDATFAALFVGLLATFTFAGHAVTGRWTGLAVVTDLVHLGAIALWLGGVAVLVIGFYRRTPGRVAATQQFSRIAAPAIAVIVITGLLQAWRQASALDDLLDTTYGRLVLAKAGVLLLIVAAASASRDIVRKRMGATLLPAGPGAARVELQPEDEQDFRNAIAVEVAFAVLILAITAVLVNSVPARDAEATEATTTTNTFAQVVTADDLQFEVTVSPASTGPNNLVIVTRTLEGTPTAALELSATLSEPARDIPPIDVDLADHGGGHYTATVDVPFPGSWELRLAALVTDIDQTTATLAVPIEQGEPPPQIAAPPADRSPR